MKHIFSAALVTVFIAMTSSAATFKSEATDKVFEKVKILKSVTLQNDDKTESAMSPVSYGLRKKAIFGLVPVRVYVLQFLAAKPEKLVKTEDGILASVKEAGPVQLHLTFLRNLSGERITDSFKEGLEANKIDVKKLSPEMLQVLTTVMGVKEFKDGESFSLTFTWAGDKATVYLTDLSTNTVNAVTGPKEFADQLLSIWFGKPADGKLGELKKELIK